MKNNCCKTQILEAYIQGELDIEMKAEIDLHLARCTDCGTAYQELLELNRLLALPVTVLPEDKTKQILSAIKEETEKQKQDIPWMIFTARSIASGIIFIVTAIVVGLAWGMFTYGTRQTLIFSENYLYQKLVFSNDVYRNILDYALDMWVWLLRLPEKIMASVTTITYQSMSYITQGFLICIVIWAIFALWVFVLEGLKRSNQFKEV